MPTDEIYEMLWNCPSCGTRKLLGKTHRHCPECGAAQDAATRYFPSDDEKIAVADHVYHGADIVCGHCSAPNSKAAKFCVQCGAPVSDSDAQVALVSEKGPGPVPRRSSGRYRWLWITLGVVVAGGITVAVASRLWTRDARFQVSGHEWKREIEIERYTTSHESGWCDSLPGGAYQVSRASKQRSTRKVPDGETCTARKVDNGDGTFREVDECKPKYRDEPVYSDFCQYQVDRWQAERTISASGNLAEPPYWPSTGIQPCDRVGCEREGKRTETYEVLLAEPGKSEAHRCAHAMERWQSMAKGSLWKAEVRAMTGDMDCDSLRPVSGR